MNPLHINSRAATAASVGRPGKKVEMSPEPLPADSVIAQAVVPDRSSDLLRRILAGWLLGAVPVVVAFVPEVSPVALGLQGGLGCTLLGLDVSWRRIPWRVMLGR